MALKQLKEINILLLGEAGVGKSTFVNAFANYLIYETMEEAIKGKLVTLIPTEFTVTDADYEEKRVKIGADTNEVIREGQSATQQCRAYCFIYGDILVRLIDTPGLGDTRGVEQDKLNFADLLSFIGAYDEIHLICLLLKPNSARITVSFEFCIKQLFCNLQKDASKNIIFLFTNARSTFYRPGDTSTPLRVILKKIHDNPPFVEIPYKKQTIYCFDNEAFRFLVAISNGIQFPDGEKENFSQSWSKSVAECVRLINYIIEGTDGSKLPPHRVMDTISVNEARRLIVCLSEPLTKLATCIEEDVKKLSQYEEEISNCDGTIDKLKSILDIPKLEINVERPDNGFSIFDKISHKVKVIGYYLSYYRMPFMNEVIFNNLNSEVDAKKRIEYLVKLLQESSNSYKLEIDTIANALTKFAIFVKNDAIAPYNDSFEDYLKQLIENQKTKSIGESIIKNFEEYEKQKKILEDSENTESCDVSAKEIIDIISNLYNLKLAGPKIKKLYDLQGGAIMASIRKKEVVYNLSYNKTGVFGKLSF